MEENHTLIYLPKDLKLTILDYLDVRTFLGVLYGNVYKLHQTVMYEINNLKNQLIEGVYDEYYKYWDNDEWTYCFWIENNIAIWMNRGYPLDQLYTERYINIATRFYPINRGVSMQENMDRFTNVMTIRQSVRRIKNVFDVLSYQETVSLHKFLSLGEYEF